SQTSFSVTHGWSAFGGADHGWQDIGLERRAWTLSQAVSGSVGSQGAATNVSALRVGADRSWRSQEHSAHGGAPWVWRIRSIAPLHCGGGLGWEACVAGTAWGKKYYFANMPATIRVRNLPATLK